MPINLFREVYMSFARLKERLTAFLKYRHLMASMNRFQNGTDEELDEAGRTCIICRDEMSVHDCKRLPICSHFFHKSCLREWLVQQQSCPTCRSDIAAMEAQERARNAAAAAADQRGGGADEAAPVVAEDAAEAPAEQPDPAAEGPQAVPPLPQPQAARGAALPQQQRRFFVTPEMDKQIRERISRSKTMRFQKKDMDPALFKVTHADGDDVYAQSSRGWPAPSLGIVRRVETGKLVLCHDRQSYLFEGDSDPTDLLHGPDGWIREDCMEKVVQLKKEKDGQWLPKNL